MQDAVNVMEPVAAGALASGDPTIALAVAVAVRNGLDVGTGLTVAGGELVVPEAVVDVEGRGEVLTLWLAEAGVVSDADDDPDRV